ncbi:MAG: type ISP restriction/modification enzyme [Sulfuricurvum sp.]|nr:type ISP restriction/modification enzyme [Sulfuricurvum sp.]MDP3021930.1 type ISP restriction/modification enzyme [Sulfuricurvum sp.]
MPRLNGFELLMASYAMAHLQMDLLLTDTGYKPTRDQRLKIYLTNSLEEYHPDTGTLFASWLSTEANEANHIKRDTPVMCVMGNPPYAVSSTNKNPWIQNLIADYKKDLNERKINLDDDYIKFIRFGQHFVDKNGSGILAYISANSFIDGITHRQMRKNLLESFDKIYILDLHGNSKKKETCLDGSADQNVFDIMQGVSINIFVKTGKKKKNALGEVFHFDLQGKRDFKYDFLTENTMNSLEWKKLEYKAPNYFFVPKNFSEEKEYEKGFKLDEIFHDYASGVETQKDNELISFEKFDKEENKFIQYRIMDSRFIDYDLSKVKRHRFSIMKNMFSENIGIIFNRQIEVDRNFTDIFVTKLMSDKHSLSMKENNSFAPLYLYPDEKSLDTERKPNLNSEIVGELEKKLGLVFVGEKESGNETFAPIDILDYIYAVLHSPTYRETYKEFLKIDFPRVPYPKDAVTFWQLVKLGGEIRQIHLLESPIVENYITQYPMDGDNIVGKIRYAEGRVYINETQYFDSVPETAWNFYIGGYQPAQKWLKDRRERTLGFEDILHYQKIIVALSETDRIMKEIE